MKRPLGMVLIERATGRPAGPVVPFKQQDFFYRIPELDLRIWHYMEFWKFESLIRESRLYFRRSDRLEDDMEGKYAEANRSYTPGMWKRFLDVYPVQRDADKMEIGNEAFRNQVFINCWHLNRVENPTMWARFTKTEQSVALRTTVRKLLHSLSDPIPSSNKRAVKVTVSKVTYASQHSPRPEWSYYGPFFYKDTKFMDEREFRMLIHGPDGKPVDIEHDLGQKIAVNVEEMVEQVVVHPRASSEFKGSVRTLLQKEGLQIAVSRSSLRPDAIA